MGRFDVFTPELLSPRRIEPVETQLPFGISWGDLLGILPGADPNGSAQAFESYVRQGVSGGPDSCILTLEYRGSGGEATESTFFFKRDKSGGREADAYAFLAHHEVPTPQLLAAIPRNETQVLVLEFLPRIGIDYSEQEVRELLDLLARLNSIYAGPEVFPRGPGNPGFSDQVKSTMNTLSATFPDMVDTGRWLDAYEAVKQAAAAMPQALTHGQFYAQQVGWAEREGQSRLVVFDLETIELRPRFSDLAGVLSLLSTHTGRREIELFEVYLELWRANTGSSSTAEELMREVRVVRVYNALMSLPWITRDVYPPGTEELASTVHDLHEEMVDLGLFDAR